MPLSPMHDVFLTFVNDYAPGLATDTTLLAVSGGVDSMVMAELFRRAGFSFAIAHCNFGLRGAESDGDEILVQNWAARHKVEFHTRQFETTRKAESEGISIQMAARDLRYTWFEELIQEFEYNYLATAHHADDNIETVLLNLTRGTGLPGLLGIAPVKHKLVRPLLFVSKKEILDFAQKEKIEWREDSSNASDAYRRNLLRHQVLPVLWEMNPSLDKTFSQSLERLRAVDSILKDRLADWRERAVRFEDETCYIGIQEIRETKEPIYYLHSVLEAYGFNYAQTAQIVASLEGISGKQFFSTSHSLFKDRESLIIEPLQGDGGFPPIVIQEDSVEVALSQNSSIEISQTPCFKKFNFSKSPKIAYFDAARILFPLRVRTWHAGDWFQPFGMGGSRKKVSDLLVDAKVPMNRKKDCLVLTDNEGNILWVLGRRADGRFGVNNETTEILKIEIVIN